MGVALLDSPDELPPMPSGLVRARINPETGLLAALDTDNGIMEIFQSGRLPEMEASTGVNQDATTEEDPYDIY
jgi:penicillin-binding protein 1A